MAQTLNKQERTQEKTIENEELPIVNIKTISNDDQIVESSNNPTINESLKSLHENDQNQNSIDDNNAEKTD